MEWKTFKGTMASTETADHQHLSNVIWFSRVLFGELHKEYYEPFINAIRDRFNGQLLPYRPHVDFHEEIEALRKRGMLRESEYGNYDIMWHTGGEPRKIGEIITFETITTI